VVPEDPPHVDDEVVAILPVSGVGTTLTSGKAASDAAALSLSVNAPQ